MSHKSWTLCPMERESRKTIFEKIFEIFSEKMAPEYPCPRPGALYVMMRYYTEKQHNFLGGFWAFMLIYCGPFQLILILFILEPHPKGVWIWLFNQFWCNWCKWWNNTLHSLEYPPVKGKISVGRILRLCWCLLLLVIVMLCPVQCASVQR